MNKRILIKNATMVNESRTFTGSLFIENENIEEIAEGEDACSDLLADEIVDARGMYLLPGVIDEHVHFREPGATYKADIDSESRAAAAGGVTTFFDMPNTTPQTTTEEALDQKIAAAVRESHVNFGFFIGATNDNADFLKHIDKRKVSGIKLFMGASTGNMLVDNQHALEQIFETATLPVMVHCEDSGIIAHNMAEYKKEYGYDPAIKYHPLIRSEEACYASSSLAVSLARTYGTRLHVAHVSTARELSLFTPDYPNITAEACLPHLLFCNDDYASLGSLIKCNPAIKTRSDRDALRAALSDGSISTVGTDHAPHAIWEKTGGCAKAMSGMPMVQFSLVSMLSLVDEGVLSIERMVELMCHAPARIFNVENRGYLREGYKADLVLVKPNSPWTLTPNMIESKCNWSPVQNKVFHWKVEKTFCNGTLIYNDGHITDENFTGQPVTFDR